MLDLLFVELAASRATGDILDVQNHHVTVN